MDQKTVLTAVASWVLAFIGTAATFAIVFAASMRTIPRIDYIALAKTLPFHLAAIGLACYVLKKVIDTDNFLKGMILAMPPLCIAVLNILLIVVDLLF
jgi:hypothetical protein